MFDGATVGAISGAIVGILVALVFFIISKTRKVETVLATKPADLLSFSIYASAPDVKSAIHRFAEASKLKVEYTNDYVGLIILGRDIGFTLHNGYWLFIYVTPAADGSAMVEVGIKSKVYQAPFALNIIRNKDADKLYKAITGQNRVTRNQA